MARTTNWNSMEVLPRIVILGLPKSGKKTLLQGLSRYFEFDYASKPDKIVTLESLELHLSIVDVFTKYYKAKIELCCVEGDNSLLTKEQLSGIINDACQGVIFVCRSVDTSALSTIQKWNEAVDVVKDRMELKLVVCSFSDIQNTLSERNMQSIKNWCIDNFYEMIPANLLIPHYSWKSQDKEGVARVVEDMECVMWSNMDTNQRRTTERVIEEKVIVNAHELEQCAYCHKSKSKDNIVLFLCSRCKTTRYCSRDCQVKDWKKHKVFCNQIKGIDPEAKMKEEEEKRVNEVEACMAASLPAPPRSKEEIEFDNFAKLMQECQATKAQAKGLPDAERKRRAAIMAAKLMKEFGLSEGDEAERIIDDCSLASSNVCCDILSTFSAVRVIQCYIVKDNVLQSTL